jgi:hypothetical protein
VANWIVRRWARYGHDRLYAETPGGTALGYFDVTTGRYHSDDLANLPLLQKAISDHLDARQPSVPGTDGVERASRAVPTGPPDDGADTAAQAVRGCPAAAGPVLTPPAAPVTAEPTARPPAVPQPDAPRTAAPDWIDLSLVAPGAAAQAQALAAREAQGRFRGFLARLFDMRTEERAWRIGAVGERAVAEQLARLGPEWRVLHAVRVGTQGADIDHVVIGPAGVFTVNAKHHPNASIWVGGNTFMVNGQRVPYIRSSRHEARRASRLLTEQTGFPVPVSGVIAVMGAQRGYTVKQQPEDGAVVVVQRRRISRHLRRLPSHLGPREVEAIFEVARRSTTWT